MKTIQLTRGYSTLVDDEDYDTLMTNSWCFWPCRTKTILDRGYAGRNGHKNEDSRCILMHRVIMNAQKGEEVDHIDGDRLNNQKVNLRLCSHKQNSRNQNPKQGSSLKGVFFVEGKGARPWRAYISMGVGTKRHIGYYPTRNEAADAYNNAAITKFGEFANLNKV